MSCAPSPCCAQPGRTIVPETLRTYSPERPMLLLRSFSTSQPLRAILSLPLCPRSTGPSIAYGMGLFPAHHGERMTGHNVTQVPPPWLDMGASETVKASAAAMPQSCSESNRFQPTNYCISDAPRGISAAGRMPIPGWAAPGSGLLGGTRAWPTFTAYDKGNHRQEKGETRQAPGGIESSTWGRASKEAG